MVVRIGTWNLENLFCPGEQDGASTHAAYQAKLTALSTVIIATAPDVLAVQEVGDIEALVDLAALAGGRWHCQTAAPDGRGIRVGFMSRLPLTDVGQVRAFPVGLRPVQVDDTAAAVAVVGRAVLRVRVHAGGRPLDLLRCHLKSKLLAFPVDGVPDGAVTTDGAGPVPSITDNPSERRDAAGSDHRPVIAAIGA